jgi:hypothetical protein
VGLSTQAPMTTDKPTSKRFMNLTLRGPEDSYNPLHLYTAKRDKASIFPS